MTHWVLKHKEKGTEIRRGTAVVDLTHIFSLSEDVISATLGHNYEKDYTPQINLFLIYSFENMQPMFYRLLAGVCLEA